MPKFIIRKLKRSELLDAYQLAMRSVNDLREKSGREPWDYIVSEVQPFNNHLYDTDSDGHWGAFFEGKMIGFCVAIVRGKQWYLGYLFVEAKYQLKGVGRKLLDRGIAYGDSTTESRALCTFPYNETALALYASFGMMPTWPIFEMERKIEKGEKLEQSDLRMEEDKTKKSLGRINKLDKEIRGYPHMAELEFFASDPRHKVCNFFDGKEWVGYSIISNGRMIAPAGATKPKYLPDIINDSFKLCLESGSDYCRIWVGGPNEAVYSRAKALGFKIGELAVFLSTKPYGDLYRYCPSHLAIF
jgi:ribosomal protein S18 acetylase RimI-like enzyme